MKNNMEEKLITFETAKLAKEKGFDGFCFDAYNTHKMKYSNGWLEYIDDNEIEIPFTSKALKPKDILSPTQSLLQKWLREEHNILVYVDPRSHHIFQYHIITEDDEIIGSDRLNNWELILEKGLQEALKLIENE